MRAYGGMKTIESFVISGTNKSDSRDEPNTPSAKLQGMTRCVLAPGMSGSEVLETPSAYGPQLTHR